MQTQPGRCSATRKRDVRLGRDSDVGAEARKLLGDLKADSARGTRAARGIRRRVSSRTCWAVGTYMNAVLPGESVNGQKTVSTQAAAQWGARTAKSCHGVFQGAGRALAGLEMCTG